VAIEVTKYFTQAIGTSGLSAIQYFQLGDVAPPTGYTFIVKYLSVSSTTGIASGAPSINVFSSATNVSPAGTIVMNDALVTATANQPIVLINEALSLNNQTTPYAQFIMENPYLGIQVNLPSAGTITVTVSFLVIPDTNLLSANFMSSSGGPFVAGNNIIMPSGSSTQILKSIIAINVDSSNTYSVTPSLLVSGSPVAYLSRAVSLAPLETTSWVIPYYQVPSSGILLGLSISGGSGTGVSFYTSYTSEGS